MAFLESVNEAIAMEDKGERIYRETAQGTDDIFIRTIFTGLADDEVTHARVLHEYARSQDKNSFSIGDISDNDPKRIFGLDIAAFKDHARADIDQLKPFDTGIMLEEASISHYKGLLASAATDEEKQLFGYLIRQEEMHLAALKKAKSFLGNPEQEFQDMENWILDGGM